MSDQNDGPQIFRVLEKLQQRSGVKTATGALQSVLAAGLREGVQEGLDKLKAVGKEAALKAFGLDTRWSDLKIDSQGRFAKEIMEAFDEEYKAVRDELIEDLRKQDFMQIDEHTRLDFIKNLKDQHANRLQREVTQYLHQMADDLAREQAESVKAALATAIREDDAIDIDEIIANHFNQIIIDDEEYRSEKLQKQNQEVENFIMNDLLQNHKAMHQLMTYVRETDMDILRAGGDEEFEKLLKKIRENQ